MAERGTVGSSATRPARSGAAARWPATWAVFGALAVVFVVAGVVFGLRLANAGAEPEGQNWWLVAELVLGLAYLPSGVILAGRGRRLLGLSFVLVGAAALAEALATQYLGYVEGHGRLPPGRAWPGWRPGAGRPAAPSWPRSSCWRCCPTRGGPTVACAPPSSSPSPASPRSRSAG